MGFPIECLLTDLCNCDATQSRVSCDGPRPRDEPSRMPPPVFLVEPNMSPLGVNFARIEQSLSTRRPRHLGLM